MKVLVVGGGGREHALAWKLAQSTRVTEVYVAPGNAGTAADDRLTNVALPIDGADGYEALTAFAKAERAALTVVGPEAALAAGIVDAFRACGLRIVGPTRAAAQLESSKAYAKRFMQRYAIPSAAFEVFTEAAAARTHVDAAFAAGAGRVVVKADGLAAGKGVIVAADVAEAHAAVERLLAVGDTGRVVIEEFLDGEEASFIVLTDGRNAVSLATSQDHKRLHDGDLGPNTGGMGAYSPAPVVTPNVHARVMQEIIQPAIDGMAHDGHIYTGFLYAGLMIDAAGRPRTVEFNCRLGDPETQPILMRLKSDLFELLMRATLPAASKSASTTTASTLNDTTSTGEPGLETADVQWDRRIALGVVMATAGYPEAPRLGDAIGGLPADRADAVVFHAGAPVTSGGRVLCVTALGDSVRLAQQTAYGLVRGIGFAGAQYRRDIGYRAIKR